VTQNNVTLSDGHTDFNRELWCGRPALSRGPPHSFDSKFEGTRQISGKPISCSCRIGRMCGPSAIAHLYLTSEIRGNLIRLLLSTRCARAKLSHRILPLHCRGTLCERFSFKDDRTSGFDRPAHGRGPDFWIQFPPASSPGGYGGRFT